MPVIATPKNRSQAKFSHFNPSRRKSQQTFRKRLQSVLLGTYLVEYHIPSVASSRIGFLILELILEVEVSHSFLVLKFF